MNGIDISNWQAGIDLAQVPSDFVIVKATEGTNYVSPSFNAQINGAANAGKLLGVYHYINGAGADGEMQHFYNAIKPWVGKAIICLDWESGGNAAWGNVDYLRRCIEKIKALTGKTIVVYAGPYQADVWKIAADLGCKTWKAQYASNNPIYGYQNNPWNEGAYSCDIRQYSGAGRLSGYNGDLDLDKAYITAAEWNEIAGGGVALPNAKETEMWCIFQPNEESYLAFCDGTKVHPLQHPDEVTAINMVYKAVTGKDIPMFQLGTKDAPWAARFMEAIRR